MIETKPFHISVPEVGGMTMCLIGSSKSGKSTALLWILDKYFRKHLNVFMSYSMHAPIYEQLQNTVEVAGFVPEIIKECYLINKATSNKYPFCIVVDYVVGSTVKHSDQLLNALCIYRNSGLSTIVTEHSPQILNATGRGNCHVTCLFASNSEGCCEKIIKFYLSSQFPRGMTMIDKVKAYRELTADHHFIVQDNITGELYRTKITWARSKMTTPLISQSHSSNGRPYWLAAGEPTFSKITTAEIDIPADANSNEYIWSTAMVPGALTLAYAPEGGQSLNITGFRNDGIAEFPVGICVGQQPDGACTVNLDSEGIALNGGASLIVSGDAAIEGSLTVQGQLIATGGISGVVPSQTAYLQSAVRQLNQPISSGIYLEPFDPTGGSNFQVPRTGIYLLCANMGFNVDAGNGATFGPSDSFSIAVCEASGPPTAEIVVSLKPWNMPGTSAMPSGQDYTLTGTDMAVLNVGVWYQFAAYVNNISGTAACPAIAAGAYLAALC